MHWNNVLVRNHNHNAISTAKTHQTDKATVITAAMVQPPNEKTTSDATSGCATHGNGQQQPQLEYDHSGKLLKGTLIFKMYWSYSSLILSEILEEQLFRVPSYMYLCMLSCLYSIYAQHLRAVV